MNIKMSKYEWVLLISPLIICVLIRWIGFDGMVGQDSYAYTEYTRSLQNWLKTGVKPEPFFWPPGYPLMAAVLSLGFFPASIILQFISSISLGISLVYLKWILEEWIKDSKADITAFIYLITWGIFAPYVFRNSLINTSDMLSFCLISGTFYHYLRYLDKSLFKDLLISTAFISYGILTRYVNLLVFIPIVVHLIWHWGKNRHASIQTLVLLVPASVIVLILSLSDVHSGFINHPFLTNWKVTNYFNSSFTSPEGELNYFFPNILFVLFPFFHPGFCLSGFLFIAVSLRHYQCQIKQVILAVSYILVSLFIAGNYSQIPRHLLAIYPMVLILCYSGFYMIYKKLSKKQIGKFIWIGIMILQFVLCVRALYPTINRNKLERLLATEIKSFSTDPNSILYSFDIDIALKYRRPEIKIQSLYNTIISNYMPGSLGLINENAWSRQWKDKNPMINVMNLKKNHQLIKLKEYKAGWNLYRIEK